MHVTQMLVNCLLRIIQATKFLHELTNAHNDKWSNRPLKTTFGAQVY